MFRRKHELREEAAGGDGAGGAAGGTPPAENWRDSLPVELRDNPSLADVNDVASLAKRFVDTKAMVGNSIRMPSEEAGSDDINSFVDKVLGNSNLPLMRKPDTTDAEAMAAVYDQMGRPEDASGYQAAEGMDTEVFGAMASKAHELGLSKAQFEALAQAQFEMQTGAMQQMDQSRIDGIGQLKGEWGAAFDEKAARATRTAEALKAPPQLLEAMKSGDVDAATLRFIDNIATQLGGEGTPLAQQIGQVNALTVEEMVQRRDELLNKAHTEDLTPTQQQELQRKLVKYSEQILAARGG